MINSEARPVSASSKGSIPASLQVSLSDQLYRQSKIDEENRRLEKKSKKGKKSKKSDGAAAEENEEDLYPTIKVTRGGELPEGVHESDHEDKDYQEPVGRNKKADPHRALNIDLDEKAVPKMVTPPVQVPEPTPKPVATPPPEAEKPKKLKKKKTSEKDEKSAKSKAKRERSDYKELLSPADDEEKRGVSPSASTTTIASATVPVAAPTASAAPLEEKPKKKKTTTKEKKSSKENTNPAPLLFDIMNDDMDSNYASNQPSNEENVYKLAAQSDHLSIVSRGLGGISNVKHRFF